MADISNTEDTLDVRDIIERVGELRSERDDCDAEAYEAWQESEAAEELAKLTVLLEELAGNGGDHQWEGVWYPVTMVRDSYFTDYARELTEEIGDWPKSGIPSYIEIDWEATARNIRMDYSSVEYDGVTYWYR